MTATYVDAMVGSDLQGDGSRESPFRTLRRAWDASATKPTQIVCKGYFSEDMADGNHTCTIRGDYMGAAVFDGNDTYLIYGFTHVNFIIKNCVPGTLDFTVWTGSGLFAGAGRADSAASVGYATHVSGVAGSPVIMDRTGLYWGVAGGTTAASYNVYSRLRSNSEHPISLGGRSNESGQNNTFYGVQISERRKRITSGSFTIYNSIFAAFDMFVDDTVILDNCFFTADTKWYYGSTEIVISGATSQERQDSLLTQAAALGVATPMTMIDCVFSTQSSSEVFNNPEKLDFSLKLDSEAIKAAGVWFGAMGPAIDVPILSNSEGVPGSFDELSANGCVLVSNDAISIDITSLEMNGEILSKILKIDPTSFNVNALFADFSAKLPGYKAYMWDQDLTGLEYAEGDILPIGRYLVKGSIVYDGINLGDNYVCVVSSENTSFLDNNEDSVLIALLDENIQNVAYIRESPLIYARIEASEGLQRGGTYLNYGNQTITYRGRSIAPYESFVAANDVDTFIAPAGYMVGVMFDDTRVPSSEWIPAQLFGEYFVWKQGGVVQLDNDGIPISSGNYLSFQTTANGGFSQQLIKSYISTTYFQLKIHVRRYRDD